jgi:hypothetical protein
MKVGTSDSQRKAMQSTNVMEDMHELKEGPNLFRILQGPQKQIVVFVPVIVEDEQKKQKASFVALNILESTGIVESLYNFELKTRIDLGEEKPDCGFKPQTNWIYLASNVLGKSDFKIKPLKAPTSVKKSIIKLETKLDLKDPECLENGLMWMYDINIEKTVEKGKPARFGTKYEATAYGDNQFRAKIPAEWLNLDFESIILQLGIASSDDELPEDLNQIKNNPELYATLMQSGREMVFPQELIDAIDECTIDLEEVIKPLSETEIIEKLVKYPINLSAITPSTGAYKFPQTPQFEQGLHELGLKTVHFSANGEVNEPRQAAQTPGVKSSVTFGKKKVEEQKVTEEQEETTTSEEPKEEVKTTVKETPVPGKSGLSKLKVKRF